MPSVGSAIVQNRPRRLSEVIHALGEDPPVVIGLQREMLDPYVLAYFTVDGEPASKARARFNRDRKRPYTPAKTHESEERIGWLFRQAVGPHVPSATDNFGVFAAFFCGSRQRRDVDNMIKLVLDALNGIAWKDDVQVTEISGRVIRGATGARSEIVVYWTLTQSGPTKPCDHCGKPYPAYPSQDQSRRFCSAPCGYAWRRARDLKPCAYCGEGFRAKSSDEDRRHCSMACRRKAAQVQLVEVTCRVCGAAFHLRPSESERRPNATCSIKCAAVARRKDFKENV